MTISDEKLQRKAELFEQRFKNLLPINGRHIIHVESGNYIYTLISSDRTMNPIKHFDGTKQLDEKGNPIFITPPAFMGRNGYALKFCTKIPKEL